MAAKRFPILFIAPSRIGDAVLASGLVKALSDEVPEARFTIAAAPLTAPLFAQVPGLQALVAMEKKPLGLHWLSLWRGVRTRHWGLVVDTRGSALARVLRRSRRAAHEKGAPPAHKVIDAARLLRMEDRPPAPFLFTSPRIEARAAALTAGAGPILAVAPAAAWIGKTWPAERFAAVVRALLADDGPLAGGRLMVVGGPADRAATDPVRATIPKARRVDLPGSEGLLEVYAALRHARLFVGNDSGLMHMAAAAGAPTLGLFGPSDESRYGPWGPSARTVRGPRDFEAYRRADPRLDQAVCHMMDLRAPAVLAAATSLIAQTAERLEA
ncbi:MAG: glycosyltransferase family 9 protein [Caulobacteraceae bacterium]